ncbi:mechanosensitive ion channel family protein [Glaciimonas soli]|nr:mechanosensitive ion channel family protein [Glaciimonas soli]
MDYIFNGQVLNSLHAANQHMEERIIGMLPLLIAVILSLIFFWFLATAVRIVLRFICKRFVKNPAKSHLIQTASYSVVWVIGGCVALNILGADVKSLITGLGLGGVALGFALKDLLSNFVSGISILLLQTFKIGDQIVVGETEGTVEQINVRDTHIRTYDGRLVLVPNGQVFMSRVTNNTASELRRASVFVYLEYGEDVNRAMSIILNTINNVPGVATDPAPSIRLRDLTTEHLYIEARLWADSHRKNLWATASLARIAIVDALTKEGMALPNPRKRQVTLENNSGQLVDQP